MGIAKYGTPVRSTNSLISAAASALLTPFPKITKGCSAVLMAAIEASTSAGSDNVFLGESTFGAQITLSSSKEF